MTQPAALDIALYQGDSFDLFVRVKARDTGGTMVYQNLTGATPKCQMRAAKNNPTVLIEFTCTLSNQTTTPGGVLIHATPANTLGLVATSPGAPNVWDLEILYSNGDKKTILAGNASVTAEVTR